jgi:hypothetical protein
MRAPTLHITAGYFTGYPEGKSEAERSAYDTVGVWTKCYYQPDTVLIGPLIGDLDDNFNIMLALEFLRLGFKRIVFKVPHGGRVTHFANLFDQRDGFDFYEVDIEAEKAKMTAGFICG